MSKYHKIQSVFKRDKKTSKFTDEYSLPEFELLKGIQWSGTEKIDGMNIRIYKTGEIFGRTDRAIISERLMNKLVPVRDILVNSDLPESTVLYGEGYGAGIQRGGHYIPNDNNFCLFDINIEGYWQDRESVKQIACSLLNIKYAPLLATQTLDEWVYQISRFKFEESILHLGARNEGVILRPTTELYGPNKNRIITKLKFKDFK